VSDGDESEGVPHRCGIVALLGRPNAGKSTLLNALLGEKIAIVASRAQTTRSNLLGVLTRPHAQILFRDTPGVNRGQSKFNLALTHCALSAAEDADLRLLLLDSAAVWDEPEERVAGLPGPTILVRTKCDVAEPTAVPRPERFAAVLGVSALAGRGIEEMVTTVESFLPEGPALYPEETLTDVPLRFLAAEQIREVVFELYRDEIPYAVAVEVEQWKETDADVRIEANLLVERESQKAIVIGAGARMVKSVGIEARRRLAQLTGKPVHLALRVKTDRNWTKRPQRVRELGYGLMR
jgi:GTP-binding protein Era